MMANYINSNILFQSYVNIDADFELVKENTAEARSYMVNFLEERAKHFLDPSVDTSLEFKSGSIIAYATVRGSLKSCLPPVIENFSEMINSLFWFSKRVSDAAVMELSFKTGTFLPAIKRTEARPGIIGKTKRILDKFHELSLKARQVDANLNRDLLTGKMRRLSKECARLLEVIVAEEDDILLRQQFLKLLNTIPSTLYANKDSFIESEYEYLHNDLLKILSK